MIKINSHTPNRQTLGWFSLLPAILVGKIECLYLLPSGFSQFAVFLLGLESKKMPAAIKSNWHFLLILLK
jgi:hypothetical protein